MALVRVRQPGQQMDLRLVRGLRIHGSLGQCRLIRLDRRPRVTAIDERLAQLEHRLGDRRFVSGGAQDLESLSCVGLRGRVVRRRVGRRGAALQQVGLGPRVRSDGNSQLDERHGLIV